MKKILASSALIVSLTFASVASTANAATLLYPSPNPGQATVMMNQLPSCGTQMNTTNAPDLAGQGWTGDWQLPMQIGTRTAWSVLMLPCYASGSVAGTNGLRVYAFMKSLNVSGAYTTVTPRSTLLSVIATCNGVRAANTSMPETGANGGIPNALGLWTQLQGNTQTNLCNSPSAILTQIEVNWQVHFNGTLITGSARWQPSLWSSTGATIQPPNNIGEMPFPGGVVETPVVCGYAIDTTDILTTLGSFFESFLPWFSCLFTPAGWDRSDQIGNSWELSGVSRTDDIITSVLPLSGSIVCGQILDLNVASISFQMSSCPVANAVPIWIKIAISSVVILAMLFLFVRRIQWTVQK